ncbi:MAG: zinc-dependent metalloprotease [Bacteriovoracaceae bacterium]|jgi:hypothetical protein|nr:zinc-dependent metalloprotease [Bacteriovoracaceae bacterium]
MKKSKVLLITLSAATFFSSCAKKKEFDTVYKVPELESVKAFKTHDAKGKPVKYLYVPMTLGTPMQVKSANPFYQGDEKLVNIKWSKDGLRVVEVEKDDRYSDNDLNDTPVLTIPGEFQDFRCTEDEYGDCTNKEEENKDLEWNQKGFFKPDFANMNVEEVNMLDLANVEGDDCITKVKDGVKLVDYEVSNGVINVELEKTYKLKNSWECISSNYYNDKLSYNSFKVRFFYSIVELDQLATKGYEPVDYPLEDQDIFGFFKNKETVLEDHYDSQRPERKFLLNRFAPNRKNGELVYYLSKSFNKKKNKHLLDATFKATEIMNKGFAKANIPFKLKMVQQKGKGKGVSPGDLRYNTVVLIDDPLANGLLGYGPSVSNPLTGEIVQAHTNMYGGVLTSTVRRVYSSAVDLSEKRKVNKIKEELAKDKKLELEVAFDKSALDNLPESIVESYGIKDLPKKEESKPSATPADVEKILAFAKATNVNLEKIDKKQYVSSLLKEKVNRKLEYKVLLDSNFEGVNELHKQATMKEANERGYHLDCDHAPEFFEVGGTVKNIPKSITNIKGILNPDKTLKRWNKLTKAQKKAVTNIVLVESYISTFIHELGHNLGLRHNFAGSFDKKNFYTDKEAKSFGMKSAPAYSSVMDYAFSNFNELAAFGKYDLAALRFAYARELEVKDDPNKVVKLKKGDSLYAATQAIPNLKEYQFCTDGNAGLNTNCSRFDEGTTLTEIAQHKIDKYKAYYKYRNYRDGKNEFNTFGLVDYLISRYREFYSMRDIYEDYERFVDIFGQQVMAGGCNPAQTEGNPDICGMIKDRIDAATLVGTFFIDLLKTPDHLCAVGPKAGIVTQIMKLADIFDEAKFSMKTVPTRCYDPKVQSALKEKGLFVIGETGKYLNGIKGIDPVNKYSSDRDVRGIWIDKALAMKFLFTRTSNRGANDENQGALVDIDSIGSQMANYLSHITLGEKLANPVKFVTNKYQEFSLPYVLGNDYKVDQVVSHFGWVKSFFGMPRSGKTNLNELILKQSISDGLSVGDDILDKAYATINFASIKKIPSYTPLDEAGSTIYYTDGEYSYGATKENVLGSILLKVIKNSDKLKTYTKEDIAKVIKLRTEPDAPEGLEQDEAIYFTFPIGLQEALYGLLTNPQVREEQRKQILNDNFNPMMVMIIESVFAKGEEKLISLMELKKGIMNTPPQGASDAVKEMFALDIDLLEHIKGLTITDELVDYYKSQLKRLPRHQYYSNI